MEVSNVGLGAVLCQTDNSRSLHPVTSVSKKLQPGETFIHYQKRVFSYCMDAAKAEALHMGKAICPLHRPFPFGVAKNTHEI